MGYLFNNYRYVRSYNEKTKEVRWARTLEVRGFTQSFHNDMRWKKLKNSLKCSSCGEIIEKGKFGFGAWDNGTDHFDLTPYLSDGDLEMYAFSQAGGSGNNLALTAGSRDLIKGCENSCTTDSVVSVPSTK